MGKLIFSQVSVCSHLGGVPQSQVLSQVSGPRMALGYPLARTGLAYPLVQNRTGIPPPPPPLQDRTALLTICFWSVSVQIFTGIVLDNKKNEQGEPKQHVWVNEPEFNFQLFEQEIPSFESQLLSPRLYLMMYQGGDKGGGPILSGLVLLTWSWSWPGCISRYLSGGKLKLRVVCYIQGHYSPIMSMSAVISSTSPSDGFLVPCLRNAPTYNGRHESGQGGQFCLSLTHKNCNVTLLCVNSYIFQIYIKFLYQS